MQTSVSFPFEDAPSWLDSLTFTASSDGSIIKIEAVRANGYLLGQVNIPVDKLRRTIDLVVDK